MEERPPKKRIRAGDHSIETDQFMVFNSRPSPQTFPCEYQNCQKIFKQKQGLKRHLTHNPDHDVNQMLKDHATILESSTTSAFVNLTIESPAPSLPASFEFIEEFPENTHYSKDEMNESVNNDAMDEIVSGYFSDEDEEEYYSEAEALPQQQGQAMDFEHFLSNFAINGNNNNNNTTATIDNFNIDQFITDHIQHALHNSPDKDDVLHCTSDPFNNLLEFVLIAFFDGCSANISEERMKLIMLIINIAMKLKMLHPELEMPTVNRVFNYSVSTKSRIPVMSTTEHQATNSQAETHSFFMNKPSEYLKFLMADPVKNPELSSLPDFTSDELTCLQQGEKWRNHPMFQAPMVTVGDSLMAGNRLCFDVWVGDLVETDENSLLQSGKFLVTKFFQKRNPSPGCPPIVYVKGYQFHDIADERYASYYNRNFAIAQDADEIPLTSITRVISKEQYTYNEAVNGLIFYNKYGVDESIYSWRGPDKESLYISDLWNNEDQYTESMKRKRTDESLMKVVVAPLTIFTDDTSGNLSNQYNMFDSYVMTPAAMSFDSRGSKNNVYFICTANKNLTAVDMLPALVDDLVKLEHGIEMYPVTHKDYVLITAPLLLMQGDNHRQSQVSMHRDSGARRCCRMCLYPKIPNPNPPLRSNASKESRAAYLTRPKAFLSQIDHYNHRRRTKGDLCCLANSTDSTFKQQMVKDFSFCDNGGKELLRLRAFDPTQDTPTELLHTIPLGVVKFLVVFLWKTALKTLENKTCLQQGLDRYSKCKAYSRAFRSLMKHSGSFVGRNFKQLVQILPVVLRNSLVFEDESVLGYTTNCFEAVSRLPSLLYMCSVRGNLEYYLFCVKNFVNDTSDACLKIDNFCIRLNIPPPLVSTQPKTHFMHHFIDNICQFGLALHFETEHGEQFNKFIREKILLTNRHNAAKDVAFAFAKQFVIRHLINGGSFLVKAKDQNVRGSFKWVRSEVGYDIRTLGVVR